MEGYKEILKFWLENTPVKKKYVSDPEFDEEICEKFGEIQTMVVNEELKSWEDEAESCLALIILLDQFSRNLFKRSPKAFSSDLYALGVARKGIERGFDLEFNNGRDLFYMPFIYSEDIEDPKKSCELFEKYGLDIGEDRTKFSEGHMNIIEKFGCFPNRNKVLERDSTSEEVEFLDKDGGY